MSTTNLKAIIKEHIELEALYNQTMDKEKRRRVLLRKPYFLIFGSSRFGSAISRESSNNMHGLWVSE